MENKQVLEWIVDFYVRNDVVFNSNTKIEVLARHPVSTAKGEEADASRTIRGVVVSLIDVWAGPSYWKNLERKYHDPNYQDQIFHPEYRAFCLAVAEESTRILETFDRDNVLDAPNYSLLKDFIETAMAKEMAYFRMQYQNEMRDGNP